MYKEELENLKNNLEQRYNYSGDYNLKVSINTINILSQENKQLKDKINKVIDVIENLNKKDINIQIEYKYWIYVLEILKGE